MINLKMWSQKFMEVEVISLENSSPVQQNRAKK